MERFRFNTAISKLMVLTNEMRTRSTPVARAAAEALTLMLAPFAPFAAEELWRDVLGHEDSVHVSRWPTYDEALAAEDTVTLGSRWTARSATRSRCRRTWTRRAPWSWRAPRRRSDGRSPTERSKGIVRPPKLVNLVTR